MDEPTAFPNGPCPYCKQEAPLVAKPTGVLLCATCMDVLPRRVRRFLLVAVTLAITPYLAWASCATRIADEDTGTTLWFVSCGLVVVALVVAAVAGARARVGGLARMRAFAWGVAALATTSPIVSFFLALWEPGFSFSRGRAHRRRGRARTPGQEQRRDWLCEVGEVGDAPPEAADGWRLNAATETASVAAFSHLAAELLALGAPPELIADAHADALDEIRHAQLCYGLAEAIDARRVGPAAFGAATLPRDGRLDVVALVRDCVVESCLYESASARVAAALASRDDVPDGVRDVLATIAEDESRHAAHGLDIVAWCVRVGPPSTLDEARRTLDDAPVPSTVGLVDGLEPWGLAGPTLWLDSVRAAREETLSRLGALRAPARAA